MGYIVHEQFQIAVAIAASTAVGSVNRFLLLGSSRIITSITTTLLLVLFRVIHTAISNMTAISDMIDERLRLMIIVAVYVVSKNVVVVRVVRFGTGAIVIVVVGIIGIMKQIVRIIIVSRKQQCRCCYDTLDCWYESESLQKGITTTAQGAVIVMMIAFR
jgi:hypothetical protein